MLGPTADFELLLDIIFKRRRRRRIFNIKYVYRRKGEGCLTKRLLLTHQTRLGKWLLSLASSDIPPSSFRPLNLYRHEKAPAVEYRGSYEVWRGCLGCSLTPLLRVRSSSPGMAWGEVPHLSRGRRGGRQRGRSSPTSKPGSGTQPKRSADRQRPCGSRRLGSRYSTQ